MSNTTEQPKTRTLDRVERMGLCQKIVQMEISDLQGLSETVTRELTFRAGVPRPKSKAEVAVDAWSALASAVSPLLQSDSQGGGEAPRGLKDGVEAGHKSGISPAPAADSLPPLDVTKLKRGDKLVAIRDTKSVTGVSVKQNTIVDFGYISSSKDFCLECYLENNALSRSLDPKDFRLDSPPLAPPVDDLEKQGVKLPPEPTQTQKNTCTKCKGIKVRQMAGEDPSECEWCDGTGIEPTTAPREEKRMTMQDREAMRKYWIANPSLPGQKWAIECLDEIDALEADIMDLKTTIKVVTVRCAIYMKHCTERMETINKLRSELTARESERQLAKVGEKMWQDEAQKAIAGVARHRKALEEKDAEISSLKTVCEQYKKERNEVMAERGSMLDELAALKSENQHLSSSVDYLREKREVLESDIESLKSTRSNQEPFTHIWAGSPAVKTPLYLHPDPRFPNMVERIKKELSIIHAATEFAVMHESVSRILSILSEVTPFESTEKKQ